MSTIVRTALFLAAVVIAPAAIAASNGPAGTWQKLPAAPATVLGTSVWTGKALVIVGRQPFKPVAVAESYDPSTMVWTRLTPPAKLGADPYCCTSAWTGKQVLVWGAFSGAAYDPSAGTWKTLARSIQGGILVWTGREAIAWGGGCCGDSRSNGRAYNPATGSFRTLPRSPLAPDQRPIGAWTGRELVLFVSGSTPDGTQYPRTLARAAAYNPATNRWRRIAAEPARGGQALWDGRELLVIGAGPQAQSAFAYNAATNRWRRLASPPLPANAATAVWSGSRVFLWSSTRGAAYDPRTNRWSVLPRWPLGSRAGSTIAWTGRSLIVWGGEIGTPPGTSTPPKFPRDGAAFTPTSR